MNNLNNNVKEKLANIYFNFLVYPVSALGILYLIFLLVQLIDLITEICTYNSDIFLFYFLRFFFFGVNFVMIIILIYLLCIIFNSPVQMDRSFELKKKHFSIFIKMIKSILCIWTIGLLGTCIPRMIILMNNKDKVGTFVSVLIYIKMVLIVPFYLLIIVIHIVSKEIEFENISDSI